MALNSAEADLVLVAQSMALASRSLAFEPRGATDEAAELRAAARPVTVFVSWAHRSEQSTDAEASAWTQMVVEFAGALRSQGVDADLDLFHAHEPDIDWTRFGPLAVERSQFVIVAISQAWAERWSGTNTPTVGAGAVGEADALRGLFAKDQVAWQRKAMVVVLPSQDDHVIPADLMRATRFWVDPANPDSLETLLRTVTGQPLYAKPQLGRVPVLPPTVAESLGMHDRGGSSTELSEFEDYSAVLAAVKDATPREKSRDRMALLMGLLDALSG